MILQHSMHSRHVMASDTADAQIYERARVRTPNENAQRDYLGRTWLLYLAREFQKTAKGLVWLETTGAISIDASLQNVTVLDAASNPFGWDKGESDDDSLTLEDLQKLLHVIQSQVETQKRPLVIESLTPIVMRHGLPRTLAFLRKLMKLNITILAPVLVETLTSAQHRAIEDMAQAVLYLHGGDLTLIRQGVRERGNVLREVIHYDVHINDVTGNVDIEILTQEEKDETKSASVSGAVTDLKLEDGMSTPSSTARPGKVKLKIEDDVPLIKEDMNRPHIFVQDNDPEFDDMDEDDPDDDLDI